MKPIILTGHTHHIKPIAEFCLPSKKAWAERHECRLAVLSESNFPREHGHPSFQKLRWIRAYLHEFDEPIIWLDADVLVTNLSRAPDSLLPMPPYCLSASLDYKIGDRDPGKAWSAGNMAWMPTPEAFAWLDQAMKDEGARWGGLWDQDALQNCQPDEVVEIRHPRIMNAVLPEFGYEASWKPGDFLVHFTGIAPEDRLAAAQRFRENHLDFFIENREPVDSPFNAHPNLLP